LTHLMQCLSEGVSATSLDNAGNTALYWSSHSGQVECVRELLTCSGQAINAQVCSHILLTKNVTSLYHKIFQNRIGDTPLHAAASRGHLEVVQLLLNSGADYTIKNCDDLLAESLANVPAVKSAIQSQRLKRQSSSSYAPEDYCNEDDGDQSD
jgi:ankyrin repeat protein